MNILCLSRAPLNYIGGIPSYCLNLYSFINFKIENFSYDLSGKINKKEYRLYPNIKETQYPSQFISGTIALSIGYVLAILKNNKRFSIIHVQHPDPLSSISAIFAKLINKNLKIVVSWHAEVYKKYFLISPFLLIIDLILFFISSKLVYFSPSHVKSSILARIHYINKKIEIIPLCISTPKSLIMEEEVFEKKSLFNKNK